MGWLSKVKNVVNKILTVVRIYDIINPKAHVSQKIDAAVAKAEAALKPHLDNLRQAETKLADLRQLYDLVFLEQTPANIKACDEYKSVEEVFERLKAVALENSFYMQHLSGYLGSQAALDRTNYEELRSRFSELTKG